MQILSNINRVPRILRQLQIALLIISNYTAINAVLDISAHFNIFKWLLVMAHLPVQRLVLILTIGPISQVNISFLIYLHLSSTITPQGTMSDCENFQLPENSN